MACKSVVATRRLMTFKYFFLLKNIDSTLSWTEGSAGDWMSYRKSRYLPSKSFLFRKLCQIARAFRVLPFARTKC